MNGAYGNDTLIGGAGNGIFNDDAGNAIFTGGAGADTFFFLSGNKSDRITEFQNGIDKMTIGLGVNISPTSRSQTRAPMHSLASAPTR